MTTDPLRLGTRGSPLALTQSGHVAAAITAATGVPVELVVITTRGDRDQASPLRQIGGKGLFTAELEEGLRDGSLDLAVHSLKDLPTDDAPGLVLGAVPLRADPRDVLIGPPLSALRLGAVVGSGSPRRVAQLRALRPDLQTVELRGNVDTRLRRVDEGRVQATLLAAAGLARLGIARPDVHPLSVDEMVPAPGQGALAVQIRAGDARVAALVGAIDDADTRACTSAERAFLHALSGGCSVPAACHVRRVDEGFAGVAVLEAGGQLRRAARTGTDPVALGAALAADVRPRS